MILVGGFSFDHGLAGLLALAGAPFSSALFATNRLWISTELGPSRTPTDPECLICLSYNSYDQLV